MLGIPLCVCVAVAAMTSSVNCSFASKCCGYSLVATTSKIELSYKPKAKSGEESLTMHTVQPPRNKTDYVIHLCVRPIPIIVSGCRFSYRHAISWIVNYYLNVKLTRSDSDSSEDGRNRIH